MILIKGLLVGLISAVVMWGVIVAVYMARLTQLTKSQGDTGLVAVAGGWNYLLHMPLVLILLTLAFGGGLWLSTR
jgi:hypothetical protein